jgi:hypothetical protein
MSKTLDNQLFDIAEVLSGNSGYPIPSRPCFNEMTIDYQLYNLWRAWGGGATPLLNGLLAFYKLSDLTDSSGNGNTLTNIDGVTFGPGKIGDAAVFNGSNYLQCSDSSFPSGQSVRTISCWYKTTTNSDSNILSYGAEIFDEGVTFFSQGDGIFIFSQFGDSISSNSSLNDNNWHNVIVTYDGTTWVLYVDGSINDQKVMGTDTQLFQFFIGAPWGGGGFFDGSVDAVGIWNRVLSNAEIALLYNNGIGIELP